MDPLLAETKGKEGKQEDDDEKEAIKPSVKRRGDFFCLALDRPTMGRMHFRLYYRFDGTNGRHDVKVQ